LNFYCKEIRQSDENFYFYQHGIYKISLPPWQRKTTFFEKEVIKNSYNFADTFDAFFPL